ncbi:MAG: hypothetical protein ACK5MU_01615 [Candidatus Saccharimonadales bacterium]
MNSQLEPAQENPDTSIVPAFDTDELKKLAKFLDALMEAELSLDERLVANAC